MGSNKYRLSTLDALDSSVLKLVECEFVLLRLQFRSFPVFWSFITFWRHELMRTIVILKSLAYVVIWIIAASSSVRLNLLKHRVAFLNNFNIFLLPTINLDLCNYFSHFIVITITLCNRFETLNLSWGLAFLIFGWRVKCPKHIVEIHLLF